MKLIEIFITPERDEFNENYISFFKDAPVVKTMQGFPLKRAVDEYGDIRYGIFNQKQDTLISYLYLEKRDDVFVVRMSSTQREFRGQGWMTYMFDYAIMQDKLKLVSDDRQTPQARNVWKRIAQNGRYNVYVLNINTGEKTPYVGDDTPWDQQHMKDFRLLAEDYTESEWKKISESISPRDVRGQRRLRRIDDDTVYGPGTSSEEFWNP